MGFPERLDTNFERNVGGISGGGGGVGGGLVVGGGAWCCSDCQQYPFRSSAQGEIASLRILL